MRRVHNSPVHRARSRFLLLLLPLLLMLAQLGAARHEIGHLQGALASAAAVTAVGDPSANGSKKDLPLDKLCEVCLAFAHLSSAAKPDVPSLPLLRFEHERRPADALHAISADAPALRNRGPPVIL